MLYKKKKLLLIWSVADAYKTFTFFTVCLSALAVCLGKIRLIWPDYSDCFD